MSLTAVALAITLLLVLISWERRERRFAEQQHDPLTGALRREAFAGPAQRRVRQGHAVLMLDLNDFKGVNDTYGHKAGDRMLASVAGRLRVTLPDSALVCRCGGDELIATVPEGYATASELDRLQREVLQQPVAIPEVTMANGYPLELTPGVSLGAGVGYANLSAASGAADAGMYADKSNENAPRIYTAAGHQPVLEPAPYPRTRDIQPA